MELKASLDTSEMGRIFGQLKARANDFRKPFLATGEAAQREFQKAFDAQGPGWAPNSGKNPVGNKTGAMERAFTTKGAPGNIFEINRDSASFGCDLDYAAKFQQGGQVVLPSGRRIQLPARPIVRPPSSEFQNDVGEALRQHFTLRPGQ